MSSTLPSPRPQRPQPVRTRALRERAAKAVRSTTPPVWAFGVAGGGEGVDRAHARAVVDLALRVGELLLSTGASASDVVATVLRLTHAYDLQAVHVDITYTSVAVSWHGGGGTDPMTVLRTVKVRSADFTRLENIQRLVREVVDGGVPVRQARERLDAVASAPHPYRRWVVTVSLALLGAAVAALIGGSLPVMALSAATTALVDRVQRRLAHLGLPALFSQAVGAGIPTLVAVLLVGLIADRVGLLAVFTPSLVVGSGIVVLLAGLSVVGAAQDAIDGYYVTAGARVFEVLMLTLGIVLGVVAVLALAQQLGAPMRISAPSALTANTGVQLTAAMAVAGVFAVSSYAGGRAVVVSTVTAGLGWVVYLVATGLGAGAPLAGGAAAAVIGGLSQLVAGRLRVPSLAVTTTGIVPLLPGLTVYRGLFELVHGGGVNAGMATLLQAAGIGMGLAAGVSLGTFVARPMVTELDRWQRRALRRSTGDARE